MNSIITYDLAEKFGQPSKHTAVKDAMKRLGYLDYFFAGNPSTKYNLPNTTLWKVGITPTQAKNDLLTVAKNANAEVERLFADEFTSNWVAIPGKSYV